MQSLLEIMHRLRALIQQHEIRPENVKITIEFLNPQDQNAAECHLRMGAQGIYADTKMIDGVCSGNEFSITGIKMQVKAWAQPKLRNCNCPYCRSGRPA